MNKPIHPAVAEHVMEENEKLRGLLREMINALRSDRDLGLWQCRQNEADRWEAALSQQAEPACDTCHGQGEVWTGETQHFHYFDFQPPEPVMEACPECGGEAEPDPTQDEREAVERFSPTTSVPYCGRASEVEAYMAEDDDGEYMTVAQHERIVASLTRPAQTEQQPVAWVSSGPDGVEADWYPGKGLDTLPIGAKLYADPIAQTEQQPVGWQSIVLHASELADMVLKGDAPQTAQRTARALLSMLADPIAQTAPQPEQSELVEALERARSNFRITLKQLNDVPEAAWNGRLDRAHQYTTQGLQQVEQALSTYRAALAAQGGE